MSKLHDISKKFRLRILAYIGLGSVLVFGMYQAYSVVQFSDKEYDDIKLLGKTITATLPPELIVNLDASIMDTAKWQYIEIKKILTSVKKINDKSAFTYIYTVRNGKMYFMADSEPAGSEDYSAPGDEYHEATPLDLSMMKNNATEKIELSSDRWGHWISILVPIKEASGKTIAVFGMDMDAQAWRERSLLNIASSVLIILLSLIAIFFILITIQKSRDLEKEVEKLKATEHNLMLAKNLAEDSNRLKTAFLRNMSHEIRTPLNAIVGFANLLEEEEDISRDTRVLYLQHLVSSSDRLLNTINDIIEISQFQTNQVVVNKRNFDVIEFIQKTVKQYDSIAKIQGLELRSCSQSMDSKFEIYSDPVMLESALKKLLSNAIKFTPKGFVEINATKVDETIEFYVKDTGIGIHQDDVPHIFDDFRQGTETLSRQFDGNGLGLTIAKTIVEMLDGKIWVSSVLGEGSTFTISLPSNGKNSSLS